MIPRTYKLGESEAFVVMPCGRAARNRPGHQSPAPHERKSHRSGATRVNIIREVEDSLQRLHTDYIDLYQCMEGQQHAARGDVADVDDVVTPGKVRYMGYPTSCHAGGHRGHAAGTLGAGKNT